MDRITFRREDEIQQATLGFTVGLRTQALKTMLKQSTEDLERMVITTRMSSRQPITMS